MHFKAITLFIILTSLPSAQLKKVKLKGGHDPGKCDKNNHGTLTLINDREDNDKLLICVKENSEYLWKTADGSNPTGEFFNPAYDCSDVLNKHPEAKDGFYWIKLSGRVPKKVWCDMTTDGGGYMLIARTDSASPWKQASNPYTVEPFGEPHWSSSLGDAPIVDFRIQVATKDDFSETRSHWSYRLQKKRPLKNLLVVNEGGCGQLPGIGDIAYVKDLESDEIVTTTFRCSQFGRYYHKSSRFGWAQKNFCLGNPCSPGFSFSHHDPRKVDFSGAFSYSTSGKFSGIKHSSTSFVGCDTRKCCACFGPPGGKKNYCRTKCRANDKGTIVKKVFMWLWVRSSLPKKQWNKCMDYKMPTASGKVIWYKLYNGNPVPVMGRCTQKEALLNDGIVVVPDNVTAQKVPPVPGLLEYRKDTKKLYLRSNETWNEIGEEEKVLRIAAKQVKEKLDQVERNLLKKAAEQVQPKLDQVERKVLRTAADQVKPKLDEVERKVLKKAAEQVKPKLDEVEKKVLKKAAEQVKPKLDEVERKVLRTAADQVKPKLDEVERKAQKKAVEQVKPKLDEVERKITNQLNTVFAQLKKSLDELKVSTTTQIQDVNKRINKINDIVLRGKSCASLYKIGVRQNGVYQIDPDGQGYFEVRCDMETDGGGWTVFQRRQDGSVDFYRGWKDYKNGFGDLNGEFWLGLDKIHRLTKSGLNVLRVDLTDFDNTKAYAKYETFTVASESDSYKLDVGSYSGNGSDSLKEQNGMKFSTRDRDNDETTTHCAQYNKGAWWYKRCHRSNLNGLYLKRGESSNTGIVWYYWKNDWRSMKIAEMKIRPAGY